MRKVQDGGRREITSHFGGDEWACRVRGGQGCTARNQSSDTPTSEMRTICEGLS